MRLLLLVFFLFQACPALAKLQYELDTADFSKRERVLQFASDKSCGKLMIRIKKVKPGDYDKRLLEAKGRIVAPKGSFVTLELSSEFFRNPDMLKKLEPDSIDELMVGLMSMDDSEDTLCDDAIKHLKHLSGLQRLYFDRSDVSDRGLAPLATMKNLRGLSFFLTAVDGSGLQHLAKADKLEFLSLHSSGLKEENLVYLKNHPRLRYLDLNRVVHHKSALAKLSHLQMLETLDINRNIALKDNCLPLLLPLKNLKQLNVEGTGITCDGLKALRPLKLRGVMLPAPTVECRNKMKLALPGVSSEQSHIGTGRVDDANHTIFGVLSRDRKDLQKK